MNLKEKLLQKGFSEEDIDKVIDIVESDESDDPLQALEKAIGGDDNVEDTTEDLSKAENGEDEKGEEKEEKDEYNESYMKKYMKRYMKENKESMAKMFGKMNKAVEDIEEKDTDAGIIETVDLTPLMESFVESVSELSKAVDGLNEKVDVIGKDSLKQYELLKASSKAQLETAKSVGGFVSQSTGRKGVSASAEMAKAQQKNISQKISPDQNKVIYQTLFKAVQNGDRTAGQIISAFEVAGQDANHLNNNQKKYINDLLKQEEK